MSWDDVLVVGTVDEGESVGRVERIWWERRVVGFCYNRIGIRDLKVVSFMRKQRGIAVNKSNRSVGVGI